MSSKVKIGFIGCGGIANAHLAAYKGNDKVEVAAVCDIDAAKADAMAEKAGANPYTDLDAMLDAEALDGVSLLTPPKFRVHLAAAAFAAGVHVFSEKPLAHSLAEGRQMAADAAAAGKHLLVAVCHRFHEPVVRAKKLIQDGALGQLTTCRNRFGYKTGIPDDVSRMRGGILLDNGAHSVDLFRFLVGDVQSVSGWSPRSERGKIEDLCNCTLLLESVDGVGGVIELNGLAGKCLNVVEVYGTDGTCVIDYSGGQSRFLPAQGDPVVLDNPDLPGSHRFQREIDHFIDCVLGEAEPVIGGEQGVAGLAVMEAAFKAIQTGAAVTLAG